MNRVGFIIYDKSFLIRKGLVSVIDKVPNSKLLHQLDSEDELIDILKKQDFDLLIANESVLSNKEFTKQVKYKKDFLIILLTHSPTIKNTEINIADTIQIEETQKSILKKLNIIVGNRSTEDNKSNPLNDISNREVDILKYIAMGYSNKEIADKLFLSAHTVVTHRKNITRKLGIKTVPGLTIYAILNKIIDINDTEKI